MKHMKPAAERINQWDNADEVIYCCPKCHCSFSIFGINEKFCHNCGQAIDWNVIIRVNRTWADEYHQCCDFDKEKEIMQKIDFINNRNEFNYPVEMQTGYKYE